MAISFPSWLRKSPTRAGKCRRTGRVARPGLEALEDRSLPSGGPLAQPAPAVLLPIEPQRPPVIGLTGGIVALPPIKIIHGPILYHPIVPVKCPTQLFIPVRIESISKEVVQRDGKIIVAGYGDDGSGVGWVLVVARYNRCGTLDTSFGNGGVVYTDLHGQARGTDSALDLLLQPDGKIVVVADAESYTHFGPPGSLIADRFTSAVTLVCYNKNGTLDTRFGSNGKVVCPFEGWWGASAALAPDGKILVLGVRTGGGPSLVACYTANGALDARFGTGGLAPTGLTGAGAIAVQPDGKILVGGSAVVRLNRDGTRDTRFGRGGTVVPHLNFPVWDLLPGFGFFHRPRTLYIGPGGALNVFGLTVTADGRIVVGVEQGGGIGLLRLRAGGRPDIGYGDRGSVIVAAPDQFPPNGTGFLWGTPYVKLVGDDEVVVSAAGGPMNMGAFFAAAYRVGGNPHAPSVERWHFSGYDPFGGYGTALTVLPDGGVLGAVSRSNSTSSPVILGYLPRDREC
jgi:uncharacterized delta-60 repeat protein